MLRSFTLFFGLLCLPALNAQSLRVENLSIKEGLSQGYVPTILQDREGFIWAGTKNGLNRYDGREFLQFTHDPEDTTSISDDQIWKIYEQGDFLLIATGAGVLDFYHKKTRRFYHLPLTEGHSLQSPYTQQIFLDANQNIWLVTGEYIVSRHICYIQLPEGFWGQLADQPERIRTLKPKFIASENVYSAVISKDRNTIFFNGARSCYSLDTRTLQQTPFHWPAGIRPIDLQIDDQDRLWCGIEHWMSCYDGNGYQDLMLDFRVDNIWITQSSNVMMIAVKDAVLGIPVRNINPGVPLTKSMVEWSVPVQEDIKCEQEDVSGNIWMGLNGKGMLKINPGFRQISHLFAGNSVYGPVFLEPNQTTVAAILPTGVLSSPKEAISSLANLAARTNDKVLGLWRGARDKSGNLWVFAAGNTHSQLVKITPDGTQKSYPCANAFKLAGNITVGDDGIVWVAFEQTLLRFDPAAENWQTYSLESTLKFIPEIYCLQTSSGGILWIGTQVGLLEANPDGKGSLVYKLHTVEGGSLRHNAVSSLLPDPKDSQLLWIGTKGGGLTRLDLRNRQFTQLHTRNGLPNDVIYGILPDAQGNLWMSSNKGIIRYNPLTGIIRNFTEADGMQSDEFNTWAFGPGPGGSLMFGGINGLNVFSPETFNDNLHVPPVFLSGLSINNQPVRVGDSTGILPQSIEYLKEIDLSFDQRNLSLSFCALEFSASVKNRFRWILEGAETVWHPETTDRSATYLNLQPGHYTFKVMAANGDGVWNPVPAELKINVLPPWYRTVWAYLVYAALIGGLIYAYLRFRIAQLRLQQELTLEHLNSERLKELDRFKSRVFTNVSHEFRTPLTVILGMAEQLEHQPSSNHKTSPITLIKRNGQNLLRLINQILDLAKLESNVLKINYVQGDMLAFIRYAAESFHSLASMKNVLLRVESHVPGGLLMMDYDPERLLHILHNLLSNAIKFTPSGGRVTLRVDLPEQETASRSGDEKRVQITVTDTGAGISPEDLPHVFDRFFQADNQQQSIVGGSGIGLSLTHELVRLMGGDIGVSSQLGKGTTFELRLPVRQTAEPDPEWVTQSHPHTMLSSNPLAPTTHYQLLLIEDNPDVVEYLSVCLGEQYHLDYAYNGRSGIERALETIPDLILSDVMMPEKDGFEVCETLKNDERSSHIPIVLLTAKAGVEDRIAGLRRGADAYLAKPFHPEELRAVLSNLLELRQKLQAKYGGDWMTGGLGIGDRVTGDSFLGDRETGIPNSPSPLNDLPIPDPEDAFLKKLRDLVEKHLTQADLSVEEISRMLGMSYPVVHRKVTALTGRSLTLYVRAIRLQHARLLLADPALSISEVAYQTGFNDPKFFSRVFSEEFGMSPTAWRIAMQSRS